MRNVNILKVTLEMLLSLEIKFEKQKLMHISEIVTIECLANDT